MATREFVIIEEQGYPVDTDEQMQEALAAMCDADLAETPVWHGDPDDPDAYQSQTRKLFA